MSRVGKMPINVPSGVEVTLSGLGLTVKGPKGTLKLDIHPKVLVAIENNVITVNVKNEKVKTERSLWGLFNRLIDNMVVGVTKGFEKKLEVTGVGFRSAVQGNKLVLNVGFSHPVNFNIPEGITMTAVDNVITVGGIDKQLVGEMAAEIRQIKKPEPYKGKGIKYAGEIIKRKAGKTAAQSKG